MNGFGYNIATILAAYLSGETIEYNYNDDSHIVYKYWQKVAPYSEPNDIYRLSNEKYKFRIKNKSE